MRNCKKCGALMRDDFVFCGVCGEPAEKNISHDKYVKTKKINRLRRFERKLTRSVPLNITSGAIWGLIAAISVLCGFGVFQGIRAASAGIEYAYSQLILKYEYVREGLSASYVAAELTEIINYCMLWALFVFLILAFIFGTALAVVHILRIVEIRRRNLKSATEKIMKFAVGGFAVSVILIVLLFIVSLILKGVV